MAENIRGFVMAQPLFDAHEHLTTLPEFAETGLTLEAMAGYANADIVTARGPRQPGDPPPPKADDPEFPRYFFDAWENTRNTGYCQAVERACKDIFGVEFSLEDHEALRRRIEEIVSPDPKKWYMDTLQNKAKVKWAIKDSINMPEQVGDGLYPDSVRVNYRDDPLLCIRSRDDISEREERWKRSIHSLDDLLDGLNQSISDCLATGKVTCFKIGLAYQRNLMFEKAARADAERAFNRLMVPGPGETHNRDASIVSPRRSSDEMRPLHDFLTHQYIRRATDERLPIQIHTGYLAGNWNQMANVNPLQLTSLFLTYPRTRFDLFHSGWPYQEIMAALGKHYPNVWVNMAWSWAMNPISMERALDTFLDAVPHNKVFAFGADTVTPFTTYAYAQQAREGIARVLERRIARGDMDEALARTVARAIMLENGEEFHGLA